jgi:pimeloyl-ACP methyl ester carboxylesterase
MLPKREVSGSGTTTLKSVAVRPPMPRLVDTVPIEVAPFMKGPDLRAFLLNTSAGRMACLERPGEGVPMLFIHANSASKEFFLRQFESALPGRRLIAIDLPGHGQSEKVVNNPADVYTFKGYARVVKEVLDQLVQGQAMLCGWSLGGHVAMELMALCPDQLAGVAITGSPPIELSMSGLSSGFKQSADFAEILPLMGKAEPFNGVEATKFVEAGGRGDVPAEVLEHFVAAAMNTDGVARSTMCTAMMDGSGGCNERVLVETSPLPLLVVCGEGDKGINNDYLRSLHYRNIHGGTPQEIAGVGHSVFLEAPEAFNQLLQEFAVAAQRR